MKVDSYSSNYKGSLTRDETERLLLGKYPGTYLVRWSENAKSYVVSFVNNKEAISHMADIREDDSGVITVVTKSGVSKYKSLELFVKDLVKTGQIIEPVPYDDNIYG